MNTTPDDGGPLASGMEVHTSGHSQQLFPVGGLSIRDWFAGMALQGYASHPMADSRNGEADRYAAAAYRFADAMIIARKEKP